MCSYELCVCMQEHRCLCCWHVSHTVAGEFQSETKFHVVSLFYFVLEFELTRVTGPPYVRLKLVTFI